MQVVTYTGNGSTQTIEVGFKVGLVWIKSRSAATNHKVVDIVRGPSKGLAVNLDAAETTDTNGVTALTDTGFTLGSDSVYNTNGATYVAWCWKAGNETVSNTVGTIGSQVNVNNDAGFSIVSYTGNGTAGATVGHGLTVAPTFVIYKIRSASVVWACYAQTLGNTGFLGLNRDVGFVADSTLFNNTSPSSSVLTLGTSGGTNSNTNTYVAYCFAPIDGYSAFGKYTGNGSADGTFVYTGFRPKFLLKVRTNSTGSWFINDSVRSPFNAVGNLLIPNTAGAEDPTATIDFLSNGFKIRTDNFNSNTSGSTYFYAAFAENPFNYSTAR